MSRQAQVKIMPKLLSWGLGLKRKTVEHALPHEAWAQAFLWVKKELEPLLLGQFKIEHVGSTYLNIFSKPVLDIMVIFEDDQALKDSIPILSSWGFIYKGDAVSKVNEVLPDPDRHFFSFYDMAEEIDYIHLHAFVKNHPDVKKILGFRDALKSDQKLLKAYVDLKLSLKEKSLGRHEYTKAKGSFVREVLSIV